MANKRKAAEQLAGFMYCESMVHMTLLPIASHIRQSKMLCTDCTIAVDNVPKS